MDQRPADQRLGKTLAMASKSMREHFNAALAEVGSTFHTYVLLRAAEQEPGLSHRELAEQLGIEGATVTHHVDRLVSEGLIARERDAGDRRVWRITLTAEGRSQLQRASVIAEQVDTEFRSHFDAGELDTLELLLGRILDRYQKEADAHHRAR